MGDTPTDRDDDAMMSALRRLMEEGRRPHDPAQVRPGLTLLTPRQHHFRPMDPVPIRPAPPTRPAPIPPEPPPPQEPLVLGPTDRAPEPLVLGPTDRAPEPLVLGPALAVPPEPGPPPEDDRLPPLLLRPSPPDEHAPPDEEPTTGPVGEVAGPEQHLMAPPPAEPAPPARAVAGDVRPAGPMPSGPGGNDGSADSFEFPRDMTASLPPGSVDPILYDATLRALVADALREELQGELGERITANLRKLIRREVLRALAARDRP